MKNNTAVWFECYSSSQVSYHSLLYEENNRGLDMSLIGSIYNGVETSTIGDCNRTSNITIKEYTSMSFIGSDEEDEYNYVSAIGDF